MRKLVVLFFAAGVISCLTLAAVPCSPAGYSRSPALLFGNAVLDGFVQAAIADEVYSSGSSALPYSNADPKEMVSRSVLLINDAYIALSSIVLPLAMLVMLFSCVVLLAGSLLGIHVVKRYGWGGLLTSCFGLLIFYGIPIIIAIIHMVVARISGS